jgi:hypothetical protein
MSSTLAGNLTITGSVANIIVIERAAADGVQIGFSEIPADWHSGYTGVVGGRNRVALDHSFVTRYVGPAFTGPVASRR